jgi:superfamily I DNA/RNA helicase
VVNGTSQPDLFLKPVVVSVAAPSAGRHRLRRCKLGRRESALYSLTGRANFPFHAEPAQDVIQAQNITGADQYVKASRIGRRTRLSRHVKKSIWPVFQEYRAQLNEQGKKEYIDLLRDTRGLIHGKGLSLPYRAVIVDKAQDMSAEAFRLMRAIVPESPNDLFIAGDAHQRSHRRRTTLGHCGINIKGRGKKLRVDCRTTEETRRFAVNILEGREVDDLDGSLDDQKGYVSLTHCGPPSVNTFKSFAGEFAFLKQHLAELHGEGAALESICVVTRTRKLLENCETQLQSLGLATYRIKRDVAEQRPKPGLRLATMHRVKGLEFEHVIVVAANKGILPLEAVVDDAEDAVARRNAETGERSLLYVALTRARRSATITGYGPASPFLSPLRAHPLPKSGVTISGVTERTGDPRKALGSRVTIKSQPP